MGQFHFNYQLANNSGYKINIVKIGFNVYDQLAYYNKENFPDIEITRPGTNTDLSLLHNKVLMTVNGYLYPTVFQGNKLYIPNATINMLRSRSNSIGMISFNSLQTNITKTAITPAMITSDQPFTLYEKALITFDYDIESPILSICGYMIFENSEFFYRTSNRTFVLRLDRLNYIEKLYETMRYRDIFAELGVPVSVNNPGLIDAGVVKSDAVVIKFLTTFNSFLVNVPVNNLTVNKVYLDHSNVPGNFRTEIMPTMPIMVGYGKLSEYYKKKTNDTKYTVYLKDAYYNQHLISNKSFSDIKLYNDHRVVGNTYMLSQAYFLDIFTNF